MATFTPVLKQRFKEINSFLDFMRIEHKILFVIKTNLTKVRILTLIWIYILYVNSSLEIRSQIVDASYFLVNSSFSQLMTCDGSSGTNLTGV